MVQLWLAVILNLHINIIKYLKNEVCICTDISFILCSKVMGLRLAKLVAKLQVWRISLSDGYNNEFQHQILNFPNYCTVDIIYYVNKFTK